MAHEIIIQIDEVDAVARRLLSLMVDELNRMARSIPNNRERYALTEHGIERLQKRTPSTRNAEIIELHKVGERYVDIARKFGLTSPRIQQICKRKGRNK